MLQTPLLPPLSPPHLRQSLHHPPHFMLQLKSTISEDEVAIFLFSFLFRAVLSRLGFKLNVVFSSLPGTFHIWQSVLTSPAASLRDASCTVSMEKGQRQSSAKISSPHSRTAHALNPQSSKILPPCLSDASKLLFVVCLFFASWNVLGLSLLPRCSPMEVIPSLIKI